MSEEQMQSMDIIFHCGNTLLDLVNDVLELSKIESGTTELELMPFRVDEWVKSVVDMFQHRAQEKHLSVKYFIDLEGMRVGQGLAARCIVRYPSMSLALAVPKCIIADSHKLKRVLINLIGNSLKVRKRDCRRE